VCVYVYKYISMYTYVLASEQLYLWDRLPRGVEECLSLAILKTRLDVVLCNLL